MLSRPPTKITLTQADIIQYEQRKQARDAMKAQQSPQEMDSSQNTTQDFTENGDSPGVNAQAQAAKAKRVREQRIMG